LDEYYLSPYVDVGFQILTAIAGGRRMP
jgi:hypothetical protein